MKRIATTFDNNGNDVFDFYLDQVADGGVDDPGSDWIYFSGVCAEGLPFVLS